MKSISIVLCVTIFVLSGRFSNGVSIRDQVSAAAENGSPANNILDLMKYVKENLERIDESATAREAASDAHCERRTRSLTDRLASLKIKAGANVVKSATEVASDATHANAAAKLDRIVKKRKGDKLLIQYRSTQKLSKKLNDGFRYDMETYALGSNVRDAAHAAFVEHQSRYNSYSRAIESMVGVMEKHFANAKVGEDATKSSLLEVGGDKDTLEWESHDAHKVHTALSELLSTFDKEQSLEHSLEESAYVAYEESNGNRDASKERLDHLQKKINATSSSIAKEMIELGFSPSGRKVALDGSSKESNSSTLALPATVTKEDIDMTQSDLDAWKIDCADRKSSHEAARQKRISHIKMIARTEEAVFERLMVVKNTLANKNTLNAKPIDESKLKPLDFDSVSEGSLKENVDRSKAKKMMMDVYEKHIKLSALTKHLAADGKKL